MGYVFIAHENGRSVFPVERRFDGPATEIYCVHAGPFSFVHLNFPAVFACRAHFKGKNQPVILADEAFSNVTERPAIRGQPFLNRGKGFLVKPPPANRTVVNRLRDVVVGRRKNEFFAGGFMETRLLWMPG